MNTQPLLNLNFLIGLMKERPILVPSSTSSRLLFRERGVAGKGEEGRGKEMKEDPPLSCSKAESSGQERERTKVGRGADETGKESNEGIGSTEEESNGDEGAEWGLLA